MWKTKVFHASFLSFSAWVYKPELIGMAWQRCFQRGGVSDRGEIIHVGKKRKAGMHSVGRNNPCGAKKQDRDASDRGEIIPVEQKSKIEMHLTGVK